LEAMNELLKLRYKTKVTLLLGILLICLLVNNIVGYESNDKLEQSANSIYADRLMPSTYIFKISELLYQERALMQTGGTADLKGEHQQAIDAIIAQYELTTFTAEERKHWNAFKSNLTNLHRKGHY